MEGEVSPIGTEHAVAMAVRAKDPAYAAARLRHEVAEKVARLRIGCRQRHNLTQAQLGAFFGMKESAISRLESGEHVPNFETLARIASGCGVQVAVSFTETTRLDNQETVASPHRELTHA
jgi:ribosome-binding protein aMBF1 (putative translation factor)